MLNTNRVRGIMRARNGSQIPKFRTPAGGINLFNRNNSVGKGVIDNINNMMYNLNPSLIGSTLAEIKIDNTDLPFTTSQLTPSTNSIYGNNIHETYQNIISEKQKNTYNTTNTAGKTTVSINNDKNKFG